MIDCFNIAYFLLALTGVQSKVEYVASGGTVKMLGDSLGISCTASGIDFDNSWLGWVRHVPGRGLQQVAYISKLAGDTVYYSDAVKGRFTISRDNSRKLLHLQMSNLRPEDAAEYYCSFDLAYADSSGTKVTVDATNSTPSHPSVFILKSQDSSGTTACLAKDFYPEEVKISMNPGSPVLYERAEPVLTARRKYGAIKIVNTRLNEDVHCSVQHNNQKIDRTLASEKQPDFTTLAPTASVTEACRTSDSSLQDEEMEKTNSLSITILGLRLLLTKSIALNMIMVTRYIMF